MNQNSPDANLGLKYDYPVQKYAWENFIILGMEVFCSTIIKSLLLPTFRAKKALELILACLAPSAGFEPAAVGLEVRCSIH